MTLRISAEHLGSCRGLSVQRRTVKSAAFAEDREGREKRKTKKGSRAQGKAARVVASSLRGWHISDASTLAHVASPTLSSSHSCSRDQVTGTAVVHAALDLVLAVPFVLRVCFGGLCFCTL